MKLLTPMPTVKNVVAGSRFTCELPTGLTYDRLLIQIGGSNMTPALLKNLRVLINGKPEMELPTLQTLIDLNTHYKRAELGTDIVSLWFLRPEMANTTLRAISGLGTADVRTLTIEGDIDAAAAAGAPPNDVPPSVVIYAEQSAARPLGAYVKYRRFSRTFAASGTQEIDTLPRNGAAYYAMQLYDAGSILDAVEMRVNNNVVVDAPLSILNAAVAASADGRGRAIVPLYTHLDLVGAGEISDSFVSDPNLVQDFRLKLTTAGPGTVEIIAEMFHDFAESTKSR